MKSINTPDCIGIIFLMLIISSPSPAQSWEKTFGGILNEQGASVIQTRDDGFAVLGNTNSFSAGAKDIYLIKTDVNGDTLWTKTYGGLYTDDGHSVQQTFDGGYILGCTTDSAGNYDIVLIKTDSLGIISWTKRIGTTESETANAVIQTNDSGFCMVGIKGNFSGDNNIYVVKTDVNGDTSWTKSYGESMYDLGYSIRQTFDGGFIISGASYSSVENHYDAYLIKTNGLGDTLWTRSFNEGAHAYAESVFQTRDSGYIAGGTAGENFYAIKVDANGTRQWTKEINKGGGDRCYSIIPGNDQGYIMAGYTYVSTNADILMIQLDEQGNERWSKKFGGSQWDEGWKIQPVRNGGYIILGNTNSYGAGGSDIYLIKTECENFPVPTIAVLDTFCQGDTMMTTLSCIPQSGAVYQWTKNDTDIVGAVSSDLHAFAEGTYQLNITDSNGCSNSSNSIFVYLPKPYFQAYPQEVCPGDRVLMGRLNFGTDDYSSFNWDFGDGTLDTGISTSHVYQNFGTYMITRTVNTAHGTCNSYQDSVRVTASAIPPVDFDMRVNSLNMLNTVACPGDRVEFIPYAYTYWFVPLPPFDASSYFWDFGDGATDTSAFPVHYYSQPGNFAVSLTVTNHCGNSNSVSYGIVIDSTASLNLSFIWTDTLGLSNDTVSACEPVNFIASGGLNYQWSFGDGNVFNTNSDSVVHAFSTAGNYTLQLVATNGCGHSDTSSRVITVDETCTGIFSAAVADDARVEIFPNPLIGEATVQVEPAAGTPFTRNLEFRIYDLQGRELQHFGTDQLKFRINRNGLPAGLYIYKLSRGKEYPVTGKIIIQ